MKTSLAGRALIAQREGRRLAAYRDTKGILTIGVGHTGRMSPPKVTAGMTISEAQCDAMLATDLAPVEAAINGAVKVPLTQNEFDALASLGFNIGTGGLKRSTVLKRLNLGDIAGAAAAFKMWDRPAVLLGRRDAEAAQFLSKDGPSHQAVGAARAATLSTMADASSAKARQARSGAAALVVASATILVTTQAHHPILAGGAAALMLALGAWAAFLAVRGHSVARTLAANADRQAGVALSNSLKH